MRIPYLKAVAEFGLENMPPGHIYIDYPSMKSVTAEIGAPFSKGDWGFVSVDMKAYPKNSDQFDDSEKWILLSLSHQVSGTGNFIDGREVLYELE